MIDNINWRQYFQEQELEEAYKVVEIEKKDDLNDDFSDGSSSNPSQDNLDIEEIYEKVYQLGTKTKERLQKRMRANKQFREDIEY